jgi:hypothetical protein
LKTLGLPKLSSAKRKATFEYSNLQVNLRLMQRNAWDEAAIADRGGEELVKIAMQFCPGPV